MALLRAQLDAANSTIAVTRASQYDSKLSSRTSINSRKEAAEKAAEAAAKQLQIKQHKRLRIMLQHPHLSVTEIVKLFGKK